MSGISAYGAYVPYTRLPFATISGRTAKEGGPEKAVAYYDEDAVTMGVAAATDCLKGIDRASVDAVVFASTSYAYREKQGAALIAKALDLRRDVSTSDVSGSLRAGTNALRGAFDSVAAGSARRVLVIASDCRMGAPRGALETKLGDGAAAFLISDSDPIATLEGSHSVTDEIQDVWRVDGDAYTHTWEDRFVVTEGYAPVVSEAVQGLLDKLNLSPSDVNRAVLYAPDARSHATASRTLGFSADQLQDALFGKLGNTGCAFAPMLLVASLESAKPGERILLAGYGDGADVLSLTTTEHLEKLDARLAVSGHLARRKPLRSYETYLRSRGLDPKEWQKGGGGGLSATIRFRERDADIAFKGGKCTSCGQVHFPVPRVCYQCFSRDQWEPYGLSDKRGRLLAHTFDYFFPAPEPPAIMIMAEIEGCHVQIQLADAAPEDAILDMEVEFAFRKIHEAGGKPNYFWKAIPVSN
ncbi:zinc ribbon domain-containing protein [Myxococcota bacterium]|nr:zinc ribbon domain-containing protein [Myxococcota bacterium]